MDSNQRVTESKSVALPLGYSPIKRWWKGVDSNHRTRRERIYSPPRLATSLPFHLLFIKQCISHCYNSILNYGFSVKCFDFFLLLFLKNFIFGFLKIVLEKNKWAKIGLILFIKIHIKSKHLLKYSLMNKKYNKKSITINNIK